MESKIRFSYPPCEDYILEILKQCKVNYTNEGSKYEFMEFVDKFGREYKIDMFELLSEKILEMNEFPSKIVSKTGRAYDLHFLHERLTAENKASSEGSNSEGEAF
jgi:hypothetical protein